MSSARAALYGVSAGAMSSGEKYAAAAYIVVFVVVLAWVAIMASKFARLRREVDEIERRG